MKTSPEIGKIAEALSKAQGSFPKLIKDKTAKVVHSKGGGFHSYSYSDLSTVIETVKPALTSNGLAIVQATDFGNDSKGFYLITRLIHSSGEWLEGYYPLPYGASDQVMGSAITYAKRYTLCALINIAGEEDDDGKTAQDHSNGEADKSASRSKGPPPEIPRGNGPSNEKARELPNEAPTADRGNKEKKLITPAQIKRLCAIYNSCGWTDDDVSEFIYEKLKIASKKDLTMKQYDRLIEYIEANPKVTTK